MCSGPVVVQFGIQFVILAIHFNSFSVEVNGLAEIFLSVFVIALILVTLCYRWNNIIQLLLSTTFRIYHVCCFLVMLFQIYAVSYWLFKSK